MGETARRVSKQTSAPTLTPARILSKPTLVLSPPPHHLPCATATPNTDSYCDPPLIDHPNTVSSPSPSCRLSLPYLSSSTTETLYFAFWVSRVIMSSLYHHYPSPYSRKHHPRILAQSSQVINGLDHDHDSRGRLLPLSRCRLASYCRRHPGLQDGR
jgi:hypothetical protein